MKKELKGYKLDNSAKVYPIITNDRYTYVFRVSATLKEVVNELILFQAINESRKRFPSFFVKLKRGFFWYYFEENIKEIILTKETPYVCERIDERFNNKYLFRFMYYENRISLEINHVLTDGGGAVMFLNAVLYRYLELSGYDLTPDESIILLDSSIDPLEEEDAYQKNYKGGLINPPKIPKAYFDKKKTFKNYGSGIINSFIDSDKLKSYAKKNEASITQVIIAVLTYSIIKNGNKKLLKKYPINVCVPVNLRGKYNAKTISNFSMYFHTSYQAKEELDFKDILDKVKFDYKEEFTEEKIQAKLDTVYLVQRKLIVKFIPLFLKWIIFKLGYNAFGRRPTTITISNFGNLSNPESMARQVESFAFYMGSGLKHAVAMNSYNGKTSVVFSRAMVSTDLEETFFRFLTEQGIDVHIVSNYWEMQEKRYVKKIKGQ